jgi:hypothetical protein
VQVDFGYPKASGTPPNSTINAVAISVRSDAGAWASRTLSEVEEQVERTWIRYSIGYLVVLMALLLAVLIFITLLPFAHTEPASANTLWLKTSDVDRIEVMLRDHPTLTDENLRDVATMQLRNVLGLPRPPRSIQANQVTRTLFLAMPLSVDEVERYANTVQRRKIVWNVIVGVTGVASYRNSSSRACHTGFRDSHRLFQRLCRLNLIDGRTIPRFVRQLHAT